MHNNETPMHTRNTTAGLYAFQKSKHAIIKYHHSMFDNGSEHRFISGLI